MRDGTKAMLVVFAVALLWLEQSAQAQTAADRLGNCLVLNSTGAERLDIVKWFTFALATSPAVKDTLLIPESDVEKSDRRMAAMATDLFIRKCKTETIEAMSGSNDAETMRIAGQYMGRMAFQDISSRPEFTARLTGFIRYLNKSDFEAIGIK